MTYLFDFDGTLVDSMPTYASQMLRILDETGTKYPDDVIKIITPLGYIGTAKYYLELGMPLTFEEITKPRLEFEKGDEFDLGSLKLIAHYFDGTTREITPDTPGIKINIAIPIIETAITQLNFSVEVIRFLSLAP